MRLVCISDTHGRHDLIGKVPGGDILIVAGDITNVGQKDDVVKFNRWLRNSIDCEHKVVIAGNHDWCFANRKRQKAIQWLTEGDDNIIYLEDSPTEINGIKLYGSPWQPWFYDWAFNLHRGSALQKVWAKIPDNTDILVTHGPPYTILDPSMDGNPVGCKDLLERIKTVQPKAHIFGHLHSGYGMVERDGTVFINASMCDEEYQIYRKPMVIDI